MVQKVWESIVNISHCDIDFKLGSNRWVIKTQIQPLKIKRRFGAKTIRAAFTLKQLQPPLFLDRALPIWISTLFVVFKHVS